MHGFGGIAGGVLTCRQSFKGRIRKRTDKNGRRCGLLQTALGLPLHRHTNGTFFNVAWWCTPGNVRNQAGFAALH